MHARERIIRDRFAGQACGHCGQLYPPDGVIVLARRPSAWMVMASCRQCQNRCIYVVSFHDSRPGISIHPSDTAQFLPDDFLPSASTFSSPSPFTNSPSDPPDTPPHSSTSITRADVAAIHRFLEHFDGNFRGFFARQRPGRADDAADG